MLAVAPHSADDNHSPFLALKIFYAAYFYFFAIRKSTQNFCPRQSIAKFFNLKRIDQINSDIINFTGANLVLPNQYTLLHFGVLFHQVLQGANFIEHDASQWMFQVTVHQSCFNIMCCHPLSTIPFSFFPPPYGLCYGPYECRGE